MKSKPIQLDLFEQAPDMDRKPCKGKRLKLTPEQKRHRRAALNKASKTKRSALRTPEQVAAEAAKAKAYAQVYRQAHKAEIRANQKLWVQNNPYKVAKSQRRHKEQNPDKAKIQYHKDIERSRAKGRAASKKRLADPVTRQSHNTKARARAPKYAAKKKEQNRAYVTKNPEMSREKVRRHRRNNPHLFAASQAKRRSKRLSATPSWTDNAAINEVYKQSKFMTISTGVQHAVDHIVPLVNDAVCGLHVHYNLCVTTFSENCRKSNTFIESLGLHPTIANGLIRTKARE